jgi:hypothetical protein
MKPPIHRKSLLKLKNKAQIIHSGDGVAPGSI